MSKFTVEEELILEDFPGLTEERQRELLKLIRRYKRIYFRDEEFRETARKHVRFGVSHVDVMLRVWGFNEKSEV